jgi:CheY-like chemotaxis protein
MPGGMNGVQLVERVRALRPGTPALLTTGYMDELQPNAERAEALDVLAKRYQLGGQPLPTRMLASIRRFAWARGAHPTKKHPRSLPGFSRRATSRR